MRTHLIRNTLTIAAFGLSAMLALGQGAGKETLAVGNVQTNKALVEAMARSGKTPQLERIVGSIDHQLISALVQSRKFAVVGRSDLKQILEEQKPGSLRDCRCHHSGRAGEGSRRQIQTSGHGGQFSR